MTTPAATVVIPTLGRDEHLRQTVADLLAQEGVALQIVVVDQGRGGVPAWAAGLPGVDYHTVDIRGLPPARNVGWRRARHDVVVFIDDDVRLPRGFVAAHLAAHASTGADIVAGGVDEPHRGPDLAAHAGRYSRWRAHPRRGFANTASEWATHGVGCNFSVTRACLEATRGFDEGLNIGPALYEETEFCLRAGARGFRTWFAADARLTHLAAPTGGCRVPDPVAYVRGLAHNRAVLIRRYSRPWQQPVAALHLAATGLAFAVTYRRTGAVVAALRAAIAGWRHGGRRP